MVPILYAVGIMALLGVVFGIVLSFADKKFAVKVDEKIQRIREVVAGANCGACGYPGCDGFAAAVARGEAPINGCTPGGQKTSDAIAVIMGVSADASEPKVARVLCQGKTGVASIRYEYAGYPSCQSASQYAGGPKKCQYSCLGLGDCVNVCHFDAMKIEENIVVVDEEKCTACGMCVKTCPRNVLELLPKSALVTVRCQNKANAKEAREACSKGCIACKRCVKECKHDAIAVNDGYARIDVEKCTRCGDCARVCPCQCITILN